MRLLAEFDVGRWFEDRGTLAVALIAALGAWGSWYGPRGARTSQREEWRRQTRLPAYLGFARSVEALEHAGRRHWRDMVGGSGDEPDDEPPTPEQLDKLVREVWRHLADVRVSVVPGTFPAYEGDIWSPAIMAGSLQPPVSREHR